jgi:hypothetical protein
MTVLPEGPTPMTLSRADAAALIGLLSVLEATSLGGHLAPDLAQSLTTRLRRDGALDDDSQAALRGALNGLNMRLRVALNETETS